MALQPDTDLLVLYRPAESKHYSIKVADLPSTGSGDAELAPGTAAGQVLMWDGSAWAGSLEIDCGVKSLGGSQEDYPD
tara:strand:- start:335 stop:568 length:234 start_codon:yes stop_codon:yes gene_type:complete